MRHSHAVTAAAVLVFLSAAAAGCQGLSHTENGALIGSGIGGLMGAAIGGHHGHAGPGAVVGALAGGLGGALIGNAEDARDQRDAAIARAQFAEQQRQAQVLALTNADLIKMAQSGLSDEVMIESVRTRGGRFDLSPDALIVLKSAGVSDRVILAVQQAAAQGTQQVVPLAGPGETPPVLTHVVVVPPAPSVGLGVVIGPRRPRYIAPPPYRSWWWYHHHHVW